ncbi:MAG: calcium-binding protein [Pirellulaceae bacterium]
MKSAKLQMVLLGLVLATGICGQVQASWNEDSDDLFDSILYLDVDDDIDRTEVDVVDDGDELDFYIREYLGGELVDSDRYDVELRGENTLILVLGGERVDVVHIDPAADAKAYFHVLLYGGEDVAYGGDSVSGGDGEDRLLYGREMYGGAGENFLKAGSQTTIMMGGDDRDRIYGQASQVGLYIRAGDGHDLVIGSDERDTIYGGPGDDLIVSYDGDDDIFGDEGLDWLVGGEGKDRLDPGPWEGPEAIYGSDGGDWFVVSQIGNYYHDYDQSEGDWYFNLFLLAW